MPPFSINEITFFTTMYYKTHLIDGIDICEKTNTVTVTIS